MTSTACDCPARPARPATPAAQAPLVLAPVLVTPTKPLTPSHVKALLWLDVLHKATARLRPTVYTTNRRAFDVALQTVGFWAYLDERHAATEYGDATPDWIGARYVEFHAAGAKLHPETVAAYRRRVETEGWVHPASDRVLATWQHEYGILGLGDPGLRRSVPLAYTPDQALARLQALGVLLDLRPLRGAVFIDLTEQGIPLRPLVDTNGVDNYLLGILRELMPRGAEAERLLLLCDEELAPDYLLLERILARAGVASSRLSLGRVSLGGAVRSSRAGGWTEHTAGRLIDRYLPRFGTPAFRLGMRLYFIATLGRTAGTTFSFPDLERAMVKAERLVAALPPTTDPEQRVAILRAHVHRAGYVDPYRLTSLLQANRPDPALGALLPLFT